MKGFVERTRNLGTQVSGVGSRIRSLMRSSDDTLSDLASDLGSTDSMAPEETLARMQAQNQALWGKLRGLSRVQEENSDLKTRVAELKDQLTIARKGKDGELHTAAQEIKALKEKIRRLNSVCEDNVGAAKENSELRAQLEEMKFQILMAKSDIGSKPDGLPGELLSTMEGLKASKQELTSHLQISRENEQKVLKQLEELRSALDTSKAEVQQLHWKLQEQEEQVAQCETLEAENLQLKAELEQQPAKHARRPSMGRLSNNDERGLDTVIANLHEQNSEVQHKNKELAVEVEQLRVQLGELQSQKSSCQRALGDLKAELQGCQQDLQCVSEERDSLGAMVNELQQQLDGLSSAGTARLRMSISRLEADVSRLAADNEVLTTQLRAVSAQVDEDLAGVPIRSGGAQDSVLEYTESEENRSPFEKVISQATQESEKLVDLSELLMAEMVEIAGSGRCERLGLSLSRVQYAGLLAAIQKAIEEVDAAKQKSILGGADKFAVLDRSLSNSLSISGTPREFNGGLIAAHLGEIEKMAADRAACVEELSRMTTELKSEVRDGADLTVHQEMRMEYLLQQLSCPDKVIKLSWQVEHLKKCVESSQREVEALKELNEQQQQELAIQWEKRQQAMAENRVHHSQASVVSEQYENLKEATDSLTLEKHELEEELKCVSRELQSVRSSCGNGHESVHQQLARLQAELTVAETESQQAQEREQKYKQKVVDLQQMTEGAFRFLQDALQQCSSLSQWQRDMRNLTDQLGLEVGSMLTHCESIHNITSCREVDLETLKIHKERLEQDKLGLQSERNSSAETHKEEAGSLQGTVAALEKKLSEQNKTSKVAGMQQEISDLQERAVHLESEVEAAERKWQEETDALQTRIDLLDKGRSNLEKHAQDKEKEIEEMKSRLSAAEVVAIQEKDLAANELQAITAKHKEDLDAVNRQLAEALDEKKEAQASVALLQEKVAHLESTVAAQASLCDEVRHLTDSLSATKEECQAKSEQLAAACAACDGLEEEVSSLRFIISRLEDKLASSVAECQRANEALTAAREQYADAARLWQEELDALGEEAANRSIWPKAVRELVERSERNAKNSALASAKEKLETLRCELHDERSRYKGQEAKNEERVLEAETARQTAEVRVRQLEGEMNEREQLLQARVAEAEDAAQIRQAELDGQVWSLKESLKSLEDSSQQQISSLTSKLRESEAKVANVQERARVMMAEKDGEVRQLKDRLHEAAVPLDGPSPLHQVAPINVLDIIPLPTQGTAQGPSASLPPPDTLQASREIAATNGDPGADCWEGTLSMEGSDEEAVASSAVRDRAVSIPVVFEGSDGMGPVAISAADSGSPLSMVERLKSEVEHLREQVQQLLLDAEDSERTHVLRDKANEVLKQEIAELQRSTSRDTVDKGYLKNVLVSAFEKGTLSSDSPMVEVLSRLLSFSPEEVQRIQNGRKSASLAPSGSKERTFFEWAGLA